jgi:uncharacterized membrane protein YphA (DoxX/SURF4 family)
MKLAIRIIAEACRFFTGAVFVFSGFVKAVDPMGSAIKIGDYLKAFGLGAFESLALALSLLLVASEFTLGVCLLTGVYRKWTTRLVLVFMAVMTPLTLYLALFNPVSDCGCFGDALVLTNWETFFKNIVLSAAAVFMLIHYKVILSFYTPLTRWFVPLFAFLYTTGFALWNYNHLPLLDFRAYKVGVNISEAMSIPDDAPQDEYEYSFIYEKDGVRKKFSLDDYPQNDTSWTFVESVSTLVREGYHPLITDFALYDTDGNDVTGTILGVKGDVMLLISPKLEKADEQCVDRVADIYEFCRTEAIPFYCVTGSSVEGMEAWRKVSGARYPFLEADETLLKTIIRSNPGLLRLRDGTIQKKWHHNDFPDEAALPQILYADIPAGVSTGRVWIYFNLLGFMLPLLFVLTYDVWRRDQKRRSSR